MALKDFFRGSLIAIGGNEDKSNDLLVLKRVIKEVGKTGFKVCIFTTASEEPHKQEKIYKQIFSDLGAGQIELLHIKQREQANDIKFVKMLEDVDLIFLTGGDQLRLTAILGGTKVFETIKKYLEKGTLIVGTSAGAAVFSDTMVYEGKSEEGLFKGKVFTTSGFGFVENIVFDTHFMSRGRIGRLIQIVTTNPMCIGVGISEDSGVILKGDGRGEVIGTGQVIIVEGSDIGHSNILDIEPGEPIAVENIRVHSLVNGFGYNFKERSFLTTKAFKSEKNK